MHFITNRKFDADKSGFDKFSKKITGEGPNELYAVEVTGTLANPKITQVDDLLPASEANNLINKYKLPLPLAPSENSNEHLQESNPIQYYASLKVACNVFELAKNQEKSVLLYVHGYNNDVKDIYRTAKEIERIYQVIVVVFTWPANGGGAVSGTLSYKIDKRDARTSKDALNRTIDLVGYYHELLTESARLNLKTQVENKYPDNKTKQREIYAKKIEAYCKVTVNMLCHSMGNYVLKHALLSELSEARKLIFDNICLVSADANNDDHPKWVDALQVRKSIYIVINENDYALSWSRRKPGEEQKARLGHYLKKLDSKIAIYVDVTRERAVGNSHSYFDDKTTKQNAGLKRFFKGAFSGVNLASKMDFVNHSNTYRPK